MIATIRTASDAADDRQRREDVPVRDLVDDHAEEADGRPRQQREPEALPAAALVGDARDQHDREERQTDPREHQPVGQALEDDPRDDRDQRGQDARHRGHDAHAPHGEAAVERGDADPAQDPADDRPGDVGAGERRLVPEDRQPGRDRHARELRDEDDAVHRRPATGQSPGEVARAPGQRRGHREQQRRDRRVETGQGAASSTATAGSAAGAAGAAGAGASGRMGSATGSGASSTSVGPGSSTTDAATLS